MSSESLIWVDGVQASALPLPDRGLDFGDGLFETLLLQRGRLLYSELHLQRLRSGLQLLGFPACLAAVSEQLADVQAQLQAWRWSSAAVRLTLTRGQGPRGYAPPAEATPRIVISATRLDVDHGEMPAPAALITAQTRWGCQPQLAGIKHLNRLEQVLAARERQLAGADEALMLDQRQCPVSVTAGNLFVLLGDTLHTPLLSECGIAGTRRSLVLGQWAPAIGLAVQETQLDLATLENADEVFYSNSLLGLRPVSSWGTCKWTNHDVCRALFSQYRAHSA